MNRFVAMVVIQIQVMMMMRMDSRCMVMKVMMIVREKMNTTIHLNQNLIRHTIGTYPILMMAWPNQVPKWPSVRRNFRNKRHLRRQGRMPRWLPMMTRRVVQLMMPRHMHKCYRVRRIVTRMRIRMIMIVIVTAMLSGMEVT